MKSKAMRSRSLRTRDNPNGRPKPARWLVFGLPVAVVIVAGLAVWSFKKFWPVPAPSSTTQPAGIEPAVNSATCAECHHDFHQLWAQSRHGLAMQPFTTDLAAKHITAPPLPIRVGKAVYQASLTAGGGYVREEGPDGEKIYPIAHVMGGKNVYYFLTPWERGRLQVLPVAYDVHRNEWFDAAASAVRHFASAADQALDWRDPLYTFNTSCHGCHVSQLVTNYDAVSDTYRTTWSEPGINCETCHGSTAEHVRLCRKLPPGQKPADAKIVNPRKFTVEQQNDSCSTCHAKAGSITHDFQPGGRFFDNFDLTTYESLDYYPDGRDLGENYTYTSWRRSPCVRSGKLSCLHCHTSSGRYRFTGDRANDACLPCHADRVKDAVAHTHHKGDGPANRCVACHMPTTEFARMRRSDHSMLPPTPAATMAFKSPNACNGCHADKDAAWSDRHVRQWHKMDYQAPALRRSQLVEAARRGDWSRLGEILHEITRADRDELVAASLARMLANCPDGTTVPTLVQALKDASPLVRASAAMAMAPRPDPHAIPALVQAVRDDFRLVRIQAAAALAGYPLSSLNRQDRDHVLAALKELEASLRARSDNWASQYNLGNFLTESGRLEEAAEAYTLASRFRPDVVPPLVNAAIAYARLGQSAQAEQALTKALAIEPANAAAHFNLGLLRAEQDDSAQAEQHLRAALKTEPSMAQAAYNLAVLISKDRPQEAIEWCQKAAQARPDEPRYAYTLAHLLVQGGQVAQAADRLRELIARCPDYVDAYHLLGELYVRNKQVKEAIQLYRQALARDSLPPADRQAFQALMERLGAARASHPNDAP